MRDHLPFKSYEPITEPLVIESHNLGTITLEPRDKLRIRREETRWYIRQRFSDGPQLAIQQQGLDAYFFWTELNPNKWMSYAFDPTWIGPDARWISHEYEYLARELIVQKNGLLQN